MSQDRHPPDPGTPNPASVGEVGEPPVPAPPAGPGGDHRLQTEYVATPDSHFVAGRCSCAQGWQCRAASHVHAQFLHDHHIMECAHGADAGHRQDDLARIVAHMVHALKGLNAPATAGRCLDRLYLCDPALHAKVMALYGDPQTQARQA